MGVWYSVGNDFSLQDGFSNTRPERTQQDGLRVLVDWVQATFSLNGSFDDVKELLGLGKLEMDYFDYGMNTFQEHIKFSYIKIQRKNENTYQLSLSGQGCREFEQLSSYSWLEVFSILKDFTNCRFTRLDIAIDDFQEHYKVDRIRKWVEKGLCITRLEKYKDTKEGHVATGELTMDSYYLGSMSSRLAINFYDKKLERENNSDIPLEVTQDSWTRTELRLKREYADQAVDMILTYDMDLGKVAFGILSKNVRFVKSKSSDANKRRRPESVWWLNFIGKVEKLKFSLVAPDATIEKSKDWIKTSVAPTLAMVYEDDPEAFMLFMNEMIANGQERLNEKHNMMIRQSRELKVQQAKRKISEISKSFSEYKTTHEQIYLNEKSENGLLNRKNQTLITPDSRENISFLN